MEVMVDKRFTKTVHHQWVQPDSRSIVVIAILLHAIDMRAACKNNFVGWIRVSNRTLQQMKDFDFMREDHFSWRLKRKRESVEL